MNRVASIVAILLLVAVSLSPVFAEGTLLLPGPTPASASELASASVSTSEPATTAQSKEWTLAVFLNGDNNLDPFAAEDMDEMAKIGSSDWLNMVVLIDRENGPASYNLIEKGKITKLKDAGELDMGNFKTMTGFAKWVVANYPAKHYILDIWNHGSGWKAADKKVFRGISYDDQSGNHITTAQLGTALQEIKATFGHNIDILNFDACLMQMAEVAFVCKDNVDYIVGSEETEPGKGTPYDDVFRNLTPGVTAETFAKAWVKAFVASYQGGSQGKEDCTQSAIKGSAMGKVYDSMNGFAKAIMAGKFETQFSAALQKVQKFAMPENVDLIHLVTLVKASVSETGVQTACKKLLAAVKVALVSNAATGYSMKNAKGLAIYFPADYKLESGYSALASNKVTMWDKLIQDLKAKKTAATIIRAVEAGDLGILRKFVSEASSKTPGLVKFVMQELNFRLHSEGGLPASLVAEAGALVAELSN